MTYDGINHMERKRRSEFWQYVMGTAFGIAGIVIVYLFYLLLILVSNHR